MLKNTKVKLREQGLTNIVGKLKKQVIKYQTS